MLTIPLGKAKFADEVKFVFPESMCCNCGTTSDLTVIAQDTRLTKYLLWGGTEMTFRLPLPFCATCAPSAKRRPKTIIHRALLFALLFGVAFLGLIVLGDHALEIPAPGNYVAAFALAIAGAVTGLLVATSRPKGKQTSYFQPVRIRKLRRAFLSGTITGIRLGFTNREYLRAFSSKNQNAISRKTVEATPT